MNYNQLFWLHIKKSGGSTTRRLLHPYYVEVDRNKKPKNFIQAPPSEYNDILNNYRVVLGDYQFKRCLFAKLYLYKEQWGNLFSFAFSREPTDRCISMFYYLYWKNASFIKNQAHKLKMSLSERKLICSTSYAFDIFLDNVYAARISDSIYRPIDIHFTTHTAPMWDDITDQDGHMLLTAVFRLENLYGGINRAFEACGIQDRVENKNRVPSKKSKRGIYIPTKAQILKIEKIYPHDFEIYEKAEH